MVLSPATAILDYVYGYDYDMRVTVKKTSHDYDKLKTFLTYNL